MHTLGKTTNKNPMKHCAIIRQIQYMEVGSMRRCIRATLLVEHVLVSCLMLGSTDLSQCTQISQYLTFQAQPTTSSGRSSRECAQVKHAEFILGDWLSNKFKPPSFHSVFISSQNGSKYKVSSDLIECKMDNNPGPSL